MPLLMHVLLSEKRVKNSLIGPPWSSANSPVNTTLKCEKTWFYLQLIAEERGEETVNLLTVSKADLVTYGLTVRDGRGHTFMTLSILGLLESY